jgi:hypothetical protein
MKKILAFCVWIAVLAFVFGLPVPSRADENLPLAGTINYQGLPKGMVNVVLPSVGDHIGGGDYGLLNHVPVEIVGEEPNREIRIARSPQLYLGFSRKLSCEVKVGKVNEVYFWIETPPVGARWSLVMEEVYPDGRRKELIARNTKPGVRNWTPVDPDTILAISVKVDSDFKMSRHVTVTVSPTMYSVFPNDYWPMPYRTLWE